MNKRKENGLSARIFKGRRWFDIGDLVKSELVREDHQGVAKRTDLCRVVHGGQSQAQPGGTLCHGGITNRRDEKSFLEEPARRGEGCLCGADHDRNDGADRRAILKEPPREPLGNLVDVIPKLAASLLTGRRKQQCYRGRCGGGEGRRRSGGVNETARAVYQEIDKTSSSADVSAANPESLAQRPHVNIDACGEILGGGEAASMLAEHTNGMGLIKEEHGTKALFQVNDPGERRAISIHAEDRFRDHENPARGVMLPRPREVALEFSEMVVRIDPDGCSREPGSIDKGGVAKFIQNDHIAAGRQSTD